MEERDTEPIGPDTEPVPAYINERTTCGKILFLMAVLFLVSALAIAFILTYLVYIPK